MKPKLDEESFRRALESHNIYYAVIGNVIEKLVKENKLGKLIPVKLDLADSYDDFDNTQYNEEQESDSSTLNYLNYDELRKEFKQALLKQIGEIATNEILAIILPEDMVFTRFQLFFPVINQISAEDIQTCGWQTPFYEMKGMQSIAEKAWLKSMVNDKKIHLFLDDTQLAQLKDQLEEYPELYDEKLFSLYDQSLSNEPYSKPKYRENFRKILKSLDSEPPIVLKMTYNKFNKRLPGLYMPLRIEYSQKDDRFRLFAVSLSEDKEVVLNISVIASVEEASIEEINEIEESNWRKIEETRDESDKKCKTYSFSLLPLSSKGSIISEKKINVDRGEVLQKVSDYFAEIAGWEVRYVKRDLNKKVIATGKLDKDLIEEAGNGSILEFEISVPESSETIKQVITKLNELQLELCTNEKSVKKNSIDYVIFSPNIVVLKRRPLSLQQSKQEINRDQKKILSKLFLNNSYFFIRRFSLATSVINEKNSENFLAIPTFTKFEQAQLKRFINESGLYEIIPETGKDLQLNRMRVTCRIISDVRNTHERFSYQFSNYPLDIRPMTGSDTYRATFEISSSDINELVIEFLGFGPYVIVDGPDELVEKIRTRLDEQKKKMGGCVGYEK